MPTSGLDYDKHGRIARVKPRTKDQDSRSITSGSGTRRHRDSSVSSSRTALPAETSVQSSETTSSSFNLDQLPSLPESEAGSPSSSSSPMLRTISNVSNPTGMTSPNIHRTPASLQRYLESEADIPTTISESQATPKAEKSQEQSETRADPPKAELTKAEPPKTLPPASETDTPTPPKKSSSESSKAASIPSSSRAGPPPPLSQESQHKELHQPAPKHPASSSLTLGPGPPTFVPTFAPGSAPAGQQAFHSPQLAYLPLPQAPQVGGPPGDQQALATQTLHYYPEYGPPPPAPDPPTQLQYAKAPEHMPMHEHPMSLLHRIHCAIPDIHTLMNSYQDTCAVVESREMQINNMEAQRVAEIHHHDVRFGKLEKEVDSMVKRHTMESNRLKLDIGNLDKRCKELKEKLNAEEKACDDFEAANDTLRSEKKQAEKKHEEEKAALTQKSSLDKDRMTTDHRANQRASHDQLQAHVRKAEAALSHQEAYLNRAHEEEKQKLEMAWTKQRRELEDKHAKAMSDLEDTLETKQKVVNEERRTYLQAREGWDREREMMTRRWEEERALLQKTTEERCKALNVRYQREREDFLKQSSQIQNRSEKEESILRLQREIEVLRAGWEADKFKFQRTTGEFKTTARTLNEQNSKLQKLTEAFGDVMDVKGK